MHNKRLGIACFALGVAIAAADLLSPATFATIPALRNELIYLTLIFGIMGAVGWLWTARLVLSFSVVCAGWAAYQAVPDWRPMGGFRPSAIFGSPNYLGGFAALCLFLAFLARLKGWALKAAVAANGLSLVLSESRGALIGVMCGLFFLVPRRWRLAWLASPMIGLVVLGIHGDVGTSSRLRNIVSGLRDFLWRPLFGWGQNSPTPSIGSRYYNVAIEHLVATGLVGFALFLWCAVEAAIATRKLPPATRPAMTGLLVAYIVNGMAIYDTMATSTVLVLALTYLVVLDSDKPGAAQVVHDHQALAE